jgi:4-diphosphocytidyl-2-C-methyl-D-erythritol kinase
VGLRLPGKRLQEIGLSLGADVPFFIFGETAFAEGVGEALQALSVAPAWYVVVAPGVRCPPLKFFRQKS